jgi:hypothetical protein
VRIELGCRLVERQSVASINVSPEE